MSENQKKRVLEEIERLQPGQEIIIKEDVLRVRNKCRNIMMRDTVSNYMVRKLKDGNVLVRRFD